MMDCLAVFPNLVHLPNAPETVHDRAQICRQVLLSSLATAPDMTAFRDLLQTESDEAVSDLFTFIVSGGVPSSPLQTMLASYMASFTNRRAELGPERLHCLAPLDESMPLPDQVAFCRSALAFTGAQLTSVLTKLDSGKPDERLQSLSSCFEQLQDVSASILALADADLVRFYKAVQSGNRVVDNGLQTTFLDILDRIQSQIISYEKDFGLSRA